VDDCQFYILKPNPICPSLTFPPDASFPFAELGELYNIASAMIGKAGGVTTAEVIHMNVPSLVFPSWDLEKTNVRHLVKMGLGIELKDFNHVAEPLHVLLQQKQVKIDSVNWQEQLPILFTSYQKKSNL